MGRLSQETLGGGEIVGRFPGAGMVVAEHPPRSGESILAELLRCLQLAHRLENGGEIVRGIHGGVALVRLASIRGYAHRYYGTPRQDDAVIAVHDPTGSLVFAVADGVSAAERAEVGAQLVCGGAVDGMLAALDDPRGPDWTQLVGSVARRLVERVRSRHGSPGDDSERAEKLFATTLVAGFVRPAAMGSVATLVHVGDSGAWLLDRGCYVGVLRQKSDPDAPVFSSTVSALPQMPPQIQPVTVPLTAETVLLAVLASPPPPLGLAHALDFSRETFDDDRTLLAVWPRS